MCHNHHHAALEIRTTPISATASTHETPNIHLNNVHSKKFNTERFLRLSQRPSGYRTSPFLRYRLPTHSKLSDTSILGKSSNSKAIQTNIWRKFEVNYHLTYVSNRRIKRNSWNLCQTVMLIQSKHRIVNNSNFRISYATTIKAQETERIKKVLINLSS